MYKSNGPEYSRMEQVKLVQDNLLKTLLGPFSNTFSQMFICVHGGFIYIVQKWFIYIYMIYIYDIYHIYIYIYKSLLSYS